MSRRSGRSGRSGWTPETLAVVARWRAIAAQDERDRQAREAATLKAGGVPCSECGRAIEPDSPTPALCKQCAYIPF